LQKWMKFNNLVLLLKMHELQQLCVFIMRFFVIWGFRNLTNFVEGLFLSHFHCRLSKQKKMLFVIWDIYPWTWKASSLQVGRYLLQVSRGMNGSWLGDYLWWASPISVYLLTLNWSPKILDIPKLQMGSS
jgi:hypothetical protein